MCDVLWRKREKKEATREDRAASGLSRLTGGTGGGKQGRRTRGKAGRGGLPPDRVGGGCRASRARRSVPAASLRAQRMADSIPRPKWFLRSPDETCGRAPATRCERVFGRGAAALGRTDGGRQKEIHQWARLDGLAGDHRGVGGDMLALFTVNISGNSKQRHCGGRWGLGSSASAALSAAARGLCFVHQN